MDNRRKTLDQFLVDEPRRWSPDPDFGVENVLARNYEEPIVGFGLGKSNRWIYIRLWKTGQNVIAQICCLADNNAVVATPFWTRNYRLIFGIFGLSTQLRPDKRKTIVWTRKGWRNIPRQPGVDLEDRLSQCHPENCFESGMEDQSCIDDNPIPLRTLVHEQQMGHIWDGAHGWNLPQLLEEPQNTTVPLPLVEDSTLYFDPISDEAQFGTHDEKKNDAQTLVLPTPQESEVPKRKPERSESGGTKKKRKTHEPRPWLQLTGQADYREDGIFWGGIPLVLSCQDR